jgi:hypothetical protein
MKITLATQQRSVVHVKHVTVTATLTRTILATAMQRLVNVSNVSSTQKVSIVRNVNLVTMEMLLHRTVLVGNITYA